MPFLNQENETQEERQARIQFQSRQNLFEAIRNLVNLVPNVVGDLFARWDPSLSEIYSQNESESFEAIVELCEKIRLLAPGELGTQVETLIAKVYDSNFVYFTPVEHTSTDGGTPPSGREPANGDPSI